MFAAIILLWAIAEAPLAAIFLGATPISRLKTRLKNFESVSTADAASENDVLSERIMACFVHPPLGKVFERRLAQNGPEF